MPRFPTEIAPIFVPMTAADLPVVMEIEDVSFPSPWSIDTYRRELTTRNGSYWVVRPSVPERPDLPRVLAYAGMWLLGDEAHITSIATHPEWRQRQIGEWLIIQLVDVARSHSINAITLEVRLRNYSALALYEKIGFVAVGLRRGYYQDTGEDARLLTLFAIDHPSVWNKLRARLEEIEGKS